MESADVICKVTGGIWTPGCQQTPAGFECSAPSRPLGTAWHRGDTERWICSCCPFLPHPAHQIVHFCHALETHPSWAGCLPHGAPKEAGSWRQPRELLPKASAAAGLWVVVPSISSPLPVGKARGLI